MNTSTQKILPDVIFYHSPCNDGFAAYIALNFLVKRARVHGLMLNQPTFVPYQFDDPIDLDKYAGMDVMFIDCSPSMSGYVEKTIIAVAKSVTVIDHHESTLRSKARVRDYIGDVSLRHKRSGGDGQDAIYVDLKNDFFNSSLNEAEYSWFDSKKPFSNKPPICAYYYTDMHASGSMLALELFVAPFIKWVCNGNAMHNPDVVDTLKAYSDLRFLISYIEDRDLWKWELASSREFNSYLSIVDLSTYTKWMELARIVSDKRVFERVTGIGAALIKQKASLLDAMFAIADTITCTDSLHAPVKLKLVQTPYEFVSELGDRLSKDEVLVAFYFDKEKRKYKVSFRSKKDSNINVAKFAEAFGGGGHPNASGAMVMDVPDARDLVPKVRISGIMARGTKTEEEANAS